MDQCRHQLVNVGDDAVIGIVKDRCFWIGIDCYNQVRFLDTDDKMKGTAYATNDGDFRAADDTRLADLTLSFNIALVHWRPGRHIQWLSRAASLTLQ